MDEDAEHGADAWFALGYDLHHRPWAWRKAADAYRRAIALDRPEAALSLGVLLQPRRGCESEAKAAFQMAAGHQDDGVAADAALRLGRMLEALEADHAGAEGWYAVAQARGDGKTRERAAMYRALSLAVLGQRDAANGSMSQSVRHTYERWEVEASDDAGAVFARRLLALATFPPTGRILRRWHATRYKADRVRRRLLPAGMADTLRYVAARRGS